MDIAHVARATLGATIAYFVLGGLFFAASPLKGEFMKYPAVYRGEASMRGVWPIGIVGMILSMAVLAVLYAMLPAGTAPLAAGARFGMLIGAFAVGSFVLHNHVNLNIGLRLTLGQAVAYFVQWTIVGVVIAWLS